MAVPSGVSVNPSGWIPTRVSLRPNRRSPFGAARFLIDVGEWVGEFSVKSVRNRYTADVYRSPSTPAPSVLSKKRRTHHTSLSKGNGAVHSPGRSPSVRVSLRLGLNTNVFLLTGRPVAPARHEELERAGFDPHRNARRFFRPRFFLVGEDRIVDMHVEARPFDLDVPGLERREIGRAGYALL